MEHGYRLYADVWENKPPSLYLMYSGVYHPFGPSLLAIRLLAALAVLALLPPVYGLAAHYAGTRAAAAVTLLCGLLFGVPFLEGTTANAETFLAPLTAWAAYAVIVRQRFLLGGVLIAAALSFKVVGLFDGAALGLALLTASVPARSRLHSAALFTLGMSVGVALLLAVAGMAGILPAMLRDALLYDVGYVGRGNGGALPWLLPVKAIALAALTLPLLRRPFPYLWTLYALAGALVSGRIFGHYLLQVVAPLCVSLALLADGRFPGFRRWVLWCSLALLTSASLAGLAGWLLAASGHDSILARRLQYYPNVVRYLSGRESYAAYRNQIDDHVTRNLALARALRRLPPGKILVWGNVPWVYVLSYHLPVTPYTSALRMPQVPGETAALQAAVRSASPVEVVLIRPPLPPLGQALDPLHRLYQPVYRSGQGVIYERRKLR